MKELLTKTRDDLDDANDRLKRPMSKNIKMSFALLLPKEFGFGEEKRKYLEKHRSSIYGEYDANTNPGNKIPEITLEDNEWQVVISVRLYFDDDVQSAIDAMIVEHMASIPAIPRSDLEFVITYIVDGRSDHHMSVEEISNERLVLVVENQKPKINYGTNSVIALKDFDNARVEVGVSGSFQYRMDDFVFLGLALLNENGQRQVLRFTDNKIVKHTVFPSGQFEAKFEDDLKWTSWELRNQIEGCSSLQAKSLTTLCN